MRIVNPIGRKGEDLAVEYLSKRKYKILERNFRKHYGEIDIVAIDSSGKESVLVFVEVKSRTSFKFGRPLESITSWKLRPLIKTIRIYAATHKNLPQSLRIDAIAVVFNDLHELISLDHVKNISGF